MIPSVSTVKPSPAPPSPVSAPAPTPVPVQPYVQSPAEQRAAIRAMQNELVGNASVVKLAGLPQQEPAWADLEAAGPRRTINGMFPQYSPIVLPESGHEQVWALQSRTHQNEVELVQLTEEGYVSSKRVPFADVVNSNPHLYLGRPVTLDDTSYVVTAVLPPTSSDTTKRVVQLRSPTVANDHRILGWKALVRENQLDRVDPRVYSMSPLDQLGMFDHARVSVAVTDASTMPLMRPQLSGVVADGMIYSSPTAEPVINRLLAIESWYENIAGLKTWDKETPLLATINSTGILGNAEAGYDGQIVGIATGPHEKDVVEAFLNRLPRDQRTGLRKAIPLIQRNSLAVMFHEVGHMATGREWADMGKLHKLTIAESAEMHIVGEAFSDLFAASAMHSRLQDIRDIAVSTYATRSLDAIRSTIQKDGMRFDVHLGTNLLTQPMHELAMMHGWEVLGEVTGAATRDLGRQLTIGKLNAISIPAAASALRDATAMRFGNTSEVVKAIEKGFSHFHVPV